jgi:phage protein D
LSLNNPDHGSELRKPHASLTANGIAIPLWEEIEVIQNAGHYASDTFTIKLPAWKQAAPADFPWWSTQTDIETAIDAGLLDQSGQIANMQQLIVGLVDEVSIATAGTMMTVRGRDYSSALIETIITDISLNLTASQVARQFADEHGLTGNVTETITPISRYGTRLTRHESEWDFLTALGQEEGFQVFMQGKRLYFGPPPTPDISNPWVIKLVPPSDGKSLVSNADQVSLQRALTLARDVIVHVDSTDRITGQAIHATYTAVNPLRASRSGQKVPAQRYYFNEPNLTQAQADQLAEAKARDITRHERIVEAEAPGDTSLTPQTVIKLIGTGTDWDQLYYIDRLTHRFRRRGGYAMTIRAKNHSTYSTVPP